MKRYLVFAFNQYHPGGGWNDFKGMFDEQAGAWRRAEEEVLGAYDFSQVVDTQTNEVWRYEAVAGGYTVTAPECSEYPCCPCESRMTCAKARRYSGP